MFSADIARFMIDAAVASCLRDMKDNVSFGVNVEILNAISYGRTDCTLFVESATNTPEDVDNLVQELREHGYKIKSRAYAEGLYFSHVIKFGWE